MTVSNRLKRFKQFKPQSAKNTMGTVLKLSRIDNNHSRLKHARAEE